MTTALIETTRDQLTADADLARAAGCGDPAAFEALYERHHRALLSFSRHMLGRVHDAEDVVQHTFLAADAAFRRGDVPQSVRAWLYTVARNRCVSILRARRDDPMLADPRVPSAENLAQQVEQREDLRALLADLRTLPEDQRAALLLAELGELSHAEVAQVLGVRSRKVKALVYQARQALLAAAGARAIPCRSIREELAVATGSARRRRHLRDHVARCDGCRAYADGVARQRASLAAILPVVPTVALRDTVLECLGGGGATAVTAGAGASAGIGSAGAAGSAATAGGVSAVGAKLLVVAAIGGAAAGGGAVAVTAPDPPRHEPRAAQLTPARMAPSVPVVDAARHAVPVVAPGPRSAAPEPARKSAARSDRSAASGRRRGKQAEPPGLALGHARQEARTERQRKLKPKNAGAPKKAAPQHYDAPAENAAPRRSEAPAEKAASKQHKAAPSTPATARPSSPPETAAPRKPPPSRSGVEPASAQPPGHAKKPEEPQVNQK